jgi:hypothetical protein
MELIDEEAEQDNEPQPEEQLPPEPPKPLAEAKEELATALKKFKARVGEVESSEKRLVEADKEEESLLNASNLSEEEQIERLSKTVARKRSLSQVRDRGRAPRRRGECVQHQRIYRIDPNCEANLLR